MIFLPNDCIGCSDRAKYRAQVSHPGWAMLFVSQIAFVVTTLINICNATKKLLGHRSLGPCKAVGEGGFLFCCSQHLPWWSELPGSIPMGFIPKWRRSWASAPHWPLWCSSSAPALSQEGCCQLEGRQERKPIFNLLILLLPANMSRKVLTVLMLLGTLALCWVNVGPGRSEISNCFWKIQAWYLNLHIYIYIFAHFSSFVCIWLLTPNAFWLSFDSELTAACVLFQLWP